MAPDIFSNLNYLGIFAQIIYWTGWTLLAFILSALIFGIAYYFTFPLKVTVWKVYGDPNKNQVAFGKPKSNRCRWNKSKTAWVKLWPLLKQQQVKPFPPEVMYQGNNCVAYEYGNQWYPVKHDFSESKGIFMKPIPYEIRQWQALQHKRIAMEYANHTFWDDNKILIISLIVAAINLALVGATIYFTYKFAAPGAAEMRGLADAIRGMSVIPGK